MASYKKDEMIIPCVTLTSWNLHKKRVFVRMDYNVALDSHGSIISDFRLKSSWPTLEYIIKHGGTPVIATHIGRPKNHDSSLSTKHLIPWFEHKKCSVHFLTNFNDNTLAISTPEKPVIYLLENLRFFSGEESVDPLFAQQLARLADYYVNDAFGTVHRSDCSITVLAKQFPFEKRSIGFLMKQELEFCHMLRTNPGHPFVMILGGGKGNEKLNLAQSLLSTIDTLIVYPAVCFAFLKIKNKEIGESLCSAKTVESAQLIIQACKQQQVNLVFPDDYYVQEGNIFTYINNIPPTAKGVSVGKKTIKQLQSIIHNAQTIFFNGMIGFFDQPNTLDGLKHIFETIAQSRGKKIIAGGDSVAALDMWHMTHHFDYLSTGGGALIACLANTTPPGLLLCDPNY